MACFVQHNGHSARSGVNMEPSYGNGTGKTADYTAAGMVYDPDRATRLSRKKEETTTGDNVDYLTSAADLTAHHQEKHNSSYAEALNLGKRVQVPFPYNLVRMDSAAPRDIVAKLPMASTISSLRESVGSGTEWLNVTFPAMALWRLHGIDHPPSFMRILVHQIDVVQTVNSLPCDMEVSLTSSLTSSHGSDMHWLRRNTLTCTPKSNGEVEPHAYVIPAHTDCSFHAASAEALPIWFAADKVYSLAFRRYAVVDFDRLVDTVNDLDESSSRGFVEVPLPGDGIATVDSPLQYFVLTEFGNIQRATHGKAHLTTRTNVNYAMLPRTALLKRIQEVENAVGISRSFLDPSHVRVGFRPCNSTWKEMFEYATRFANANLEAREFVDNESVQLGITLRITTSIVHREKREFDEDSLPLHHEVGDHSAATAAASGADFHGIQQLES